MIRLIGILLAAIMISSCTTITPTATSTSAAPSVPNKSRQVALNNIQNWKLNGKIAVQTARDAGSATVNWTQNQGHYSIALYGPLGSNGLKLSGQPGSVSLETSDGKHFSANNPEQLLAEKWGWNLPVSNLKYWVRGLPVPGIASNTHLDASGRLSDLNQQGWNIRYLSYANTGGVDLPNKIFITSPALRVKLIIYQWQVG